MRVAQTLILIPVFLQVALTLIVLAMLFVERVRSMRERRQKPDDVAVAAPTDWSLQAQKLSNNYGNLLELPVLFYVAALFALALRLVDVWMLGLAFAFVISRIVHTVIHVGRNSVLPRFYAAMIGMIIVSAMWLLLMWRVASSGF